MIRVRPTPAGSAFVREAALRAASSPDSMGSTASVPRGWASEIVSRRRPDSRPKPLWQRQHDRAEDADRQHHGNQLERQQVLRVEHPAERLGVAAHQCDVLPEWQFLGRR